MLCIVPHLVVEGGLSKVGLTEKGAVHKATPHLVVKQPFNWALLNGFS